MKVKFKKLNEKAILPKQAYEGDVGFDLFACLDGKELILMPGERVLVQCGFSMELPFCYEAQIRPRSGLAIKHGITVLNSPGTIDAGYRGPVGVILVNLGKDAFVIESGLKMAQMVIAMVAHSVSFEVVDELSDSERGEDGFGSTDNK